MFLCMNEGGVVATPIVLEGSQGFGVKCGKSELLRKVPKKGHFKTKN